MTGTEQLRKQLETMRESLRAFEDPIVEEIAGLRLMHETLREREQHIAQQIRKNETATLTVTIKGAAAEGEGVPATIVLLVLGALRNAVEVVAQGLTGGWAAVPAVEDVAAAVEPHLKECEIDGSDVSLTLIRPPGELSAQLADPDSAAPLAELAYAEVLRVIQRAAAGKADTEAATLAALRPLGDVLLSLPVVLELSLEPHIVKPVDVTLDRVGAQRLLASDSDG